MNLRSPGLQPEILSQKQISKHPPSFLIHLSKPSNSFPSVQTPLKCSCTLQSTYNFYILAKWTVFIKIIRVYTFSMFSFLWKESWLNSWFRHCFLLMPTPDLTKCKSLPYSLISYLHIIPLSHWFQHACSVETPSVAYKCLNHRFATYFILLHCSVYHSAGHTANHLTTLSNV